MVDKYKDDEAFKQVYDGFLFYISVNFQNSDLANLNVRKALSLAINRKDLCENVLKDGSQAASGFVPSGLSISPEGKDFRDEADTYTSYDKKAAQAATKNVTRVSIVDERTIPHEATGVCGASRVMLKPAAKGTGVKAGGPVRSVLEMAGVKDILSKSLGSNTKINMAYATLNALKSQRTAEQVAKLRGKKVEDLI